jgi:diguanylate cyclase (GGDEF)-like protein
MRDQVTKREGRYDALLHAAMASMPYGFSIWDEEMRLVIYNQTYLDMFRLPAERLPPGLDLREMAALNHTLGDFDGLSADAIYAIYLDRFSGDAAKVLEHVVRDRAIRSTMVRIAGLGWVETHQDVTEQRHRDDEIRTRALELEIQNIRFDAAINNMLHGLAMFDTDKRMIVCNRQYAELYGLPPNLTRPGTSFWDVLAHGEATGMISTAEPEALLTELHAVIKAGRPLKQNVAMRNGRVIAVMHQPMKGGGWISTHEDVTEQHRSEEHIRHLARHDALTDLPNRVLFREEMARLEARIGRSETIALLLVDLDRFKAINDKYGHAVGDEVLVTVARRLREASRETDTLARLGGDEFAVLVGPLDNPKHAALIADRIVRSLGRPMMAEGWSITSGASVGIAVAPADGSDAETLLKNADLALYRAKSEGRGVYHFFEPGMDDAMQHRRAVEASLKAAIANGDFRLVYQPQLSLPDNRIRCLEALLRWSHPERGLVPPVDFLTVAEETGLIVDIGDWVLREACQAARHWPDDVRVAVNLSAPQFRSRDLVESVRCALAEAILPGSRLELEITEAMLHAEPEATMETLSRLKALGVRVVIDDFGAGQLSLRHLTSFPFDKLKVDRALLDGVAGNGEPMAVVGAMLDLGRSLGIATAAKGIETEKEFDRVCRHGCAEVQGFLFSPPLPLSAIDALLGIAKTKTPGTLEPVGNAA